MRLLLRCCLSLLLLMPLIGWSAESEKDQARKIFEAGLVAMRQSDTDPSQSITAAILMTQAKELYTKIGDTDSLQEVNSCLFWCKKRLNNDQINEYLAKVKKNTPTEVAVIEEQIKTVVKNVEQIAAKPVTQDESKSFMDRADQFAQKNPLKYFEINVRYMEVAERFEKIDMAVASQAFRKASDALKGYGESLKKEAAQLEKDQKALSEKAKLVDGAIDTLFSAPKVVSTTGLPVPSPELVSKAVANLQNTYAEKYRSAMPNAKADLCAELFTKAKTSQGDSTLCYSMITEACRLASDSKVQDIGLILNAGDFLAKTFANVDSQTEKKRLLALGSTPLNTAAIKLINNPDDADANTLVGLSFCFTHGDFVSGLPMLIRSGDTFLADLSKKEIAKDTNALRQLEIADGWNKQVKDGKYKNYTIKMSARAVEFYRQALKTGLTGGSKDQAEKTANELEMSVPLELSEIKDWNKITNRDWERLQGTIMKIDGGKLEIKTGVVLREGQTVRVVPHPTDKWTLYMNYSDPVETTWQGSRKDGWDKSTKFNFGEVTLSLSQNGGMLKMGEVSGPGSIFIRRGSNYLSKGTIRLKFIPVKNQ
jgi:hypothetical protein